LARRGIIDNVRGYLVYGDYRERNPSTAIMDAVARGDIDVGIGYFASRESVPLKVTLVTPQNDGPRQLLQPSSDVVRLSDRRNLR
jgi:mxaJ protein